MIISNILKNETIKGITLSLLSLAILEIGTISILAGLSNEGILYYGDVEYYSLLVFNAIIAGLLGIGIVRRN